jgi:hypothetical protein
MLPSPFSPLPAYRSLGVGGSLRAIPTAVGRSGNLTTYSTTTAIPAEAGIQLRLILYHFLATCYLILVNSLAGTAVALGVIAVAPRPHTGPAP